MTSAQTQKVISFSSSYQVMNEKWPHGCAPITLQPKKLRSVDIDIVFF